MLKDIAVDVLKIDMKFLSDTDQEGRSQNILASVVRMAKWLNLPVIAEGVERGSRWTFCTASDVSMYRGFYFARPMPVSDYEKLVSEKKDELAGEISGRTRDRRGYALERDFTDGKRVLRHDGAGGHL